MSSTGAAARGAGWACVAVTVFALALRLVGLGYLLPCWTEPDNIYVGQAAMIRSPNPGADYATYPLLVGYTVLALPEDDVAVPADAPLERHLERASAPQLRTRWVVACLSALIAPATWFVARAFVGPGSSTVAALFAATSLLHLNFSQQARPHAPVTAALALALCFALRARRTGRTSDGWLAALAAMLPIGLLHTGVFALPPLFVAHVLRNGTRRARDPARLLVPLLCAVVAVLAFYPSLRPGSFGLGAKSADSGLIVGGHLIDWSWFDGSGFSVLLLGLWRNDPVLVVLAGVGVFCAARAWSRRTPSTPVADAAVVAAACVPYLLVFGIYEKSYDRFALPLVPVLAVLAAVALRDVSAFASRGRAVVAAFVVVLALALPCFAATKLAWLRSRPDSIALAARWVGAHVEPDVERLWLQPGMELPLASTADAVEHNRASFRSFTGFYWTKYQEAHPLAASRAFDARALPDLWQPFWREVEGTPLDALATLGDSYVACMRFQDRGLGVRITHLQAELERFGTLVELQRPIAKPRFGYSALTYDNPHFLADLLDAELVGPEVLVYRLERCE
ncbi:MAG: glycosyltransferase family 39 protein [Planctomycetes bacterium]|nr:glycosyltransferase family 39 protein [Planctomycetota bacterium]